jgi:hypothetical protein
VTLVCCGMKQRGRTSAAALATVAIDGRPPLLRPPVSLSEAERAVFIATVTAVKPGRLQPYDLPLLMRYCEIVALSDHAAERLRVNVMKGRPSQWLATQERLTKLLIALGRQLRLSPLARTPNKSGHPPAVDPHGGNGHISVYESMRLQDGQA